MSTDPVLIDPRGPRFAAALTAFLLAASLVTGAWWVLAAQALIFGIGSLRGVQHTPYAALFRRYVRPHLTPATELEDARPPRFAQSIGLGFAVAGLFAALAGWTTLFLIATGLALAAAFLNAAFGLCLGCEVYLLIHRARSRQTTPLNLNEEISA